MKMNLKKINKEVIFNKKTIFIFLISLFIISIVAGIVFFNFLSSTDINNIKENIKHYFIIKDNYDYLKLLSESFSSNIFYVIILWLLGISIIGFFLVLFYYFLEGFSIGFTIAGIFNLYGIKGIIGTICYLIPTKIIYIFILFYITYFGVIFSYKVIKYLFFKRDIDLHKEMSKYVKVLINSLILIILYCLFLVFIDPIMIKIFTFF